MLDELRERIAAYLSQNQVCVISTGSSLKASAVTAQYRNRELELDCCVPRWSDALYYLEQDPYVLVTVLDTHSNHSRWMQYRGIARVDSAQANDRYVTIHLTPERVDLIDETHGWGARETLEM